jgi:hypothetical protein
MKQEPGARSQEPGARSQEPGARSQEPGARSQEPGARSQEPGVQEIWSSGVLEFEGYARLSGASHWLWTMINGLSVPATARR